MKKVLLLLCFVLSISFSFAQKGKKSTPNYRLAERFSQEKIGKMVHSTSVRPNWLTKGNRFWYQYKTSEGSNYYIVDPDKRTRTKLFDNAKMAKWLSEITGDPYDAKHLPRFKFKFVKNETAIRFRVTSNEEVEAKDEKKDKKKDDAKKDSTKTKKAKKKKPKMEKKIYHLEYRLGGNGLTIIDNEKEKKEHKRWANIAPDSTIVLFARNHNLYWMDKENFKKAIKDKEEKDTTIVEHQWTKDGEKHYGYDSSRNWGKTDTEIEKDKDKRKFVSGFWSHDSKKFVLTKTDSRHIKDLWVLHTSGDKRPEIETYKYHMAGEQEYFKTDMLVFDIPSKEMTKVKLDTTVQQNVSIYWHNYKKSTPDDAHTPTKLVSKKGKIYYNTLSRDRKRLDIWVADINTGETKKLIEDHSNTYIERGGRSFRLFNNESEILLWSERDGWGHFYLYDANGNLKRQVTNGEYHVDRLQGINEKTRTILFTANGVKKGEDPYYAHLYKISLNGTGFKSLNPGDYNTSVSTSDSNQYFVSNYSRVNTVPKSELRNSNGSLVMKLEEADLSQLFAAGYKFPEPFKVKADDGITDIYGVMYKPYDFDSTKVYPLIEYVYPGPQTEAVSKSFSQYMTRTDRMAQLGFVVITLGNRGGHPARSKWYHTYGYGNLRDYGLADKKYVAEQLADQHEYIDISKGVGIFGHSGGGFMSTAAMLVYPDFFSVAVSSAGNHDNNVYNSWWSETHHGIKEEKGADGKVKYKYLIDKNQSLAKNLKGNLMLVTGDIDNNVHPAGTIRMVKALIKANKRFDFMLFPGSRHGIRDREYFFWRRAEYFVKHLMGDEINSADIIQMNRHNPLKR